MDANTFFNNQAGKAKAPFRRNEFVGYRRGRTHPERQDLYIRRLSGHSHRPASSTGGHDTLSCATTDGRNRELQPVPRNHLQSIPDDVGEWHDAPDTVSKQHYTGVDARPGRRKSHARTARTPTRAATPITSSSIPRGRSETISTISVSTRTSVRPTVSFSIVMTTRWVLPPECCRLGRTTMGQTLANIFKRVEAAAPAAPRTGQ